MQRTNTATGLNGDRPMRWWIRGYLILGALQAIIIGGTGLVKPAGIQVPVPVSPLNARFIAALYLAAAVGLILSLFVRRREDARLFVLAFGLATTMILALTLIYWPEFMSDIADHRLSWIWSYIVDPPLAIAVIWAGGLIAPRRPGRHRLTPLFLVQAALFTALGLLLLLAPGPMAQVWPWELPARLSQLYACFFFAFALGAIICAEEFRPVTVRNFAAASLALMVFVIIASIMHLPRFKAGIETWVWFFAFGLGAVVFAIVLAMQLLPGAGGALSKTTPQPAGGRSAS